MGVTARRSLICAVAAAIILVVGHWAAAVVAQALWVRAVAPEAAAFVLRWTFATGALGLVSLVGTAAWFALNLTFVSRAIGSIQLPRRLGGIEIREAVPREAHIPVVLALSILAGVAFGGVPPHAVARIALAWHGLRFKIPDPVLGRDAGLYVAQLPVWLGGLAFTRRLIWGAISVVSLIYLALGALRIGHGGVALSDHVRLHLGLLGCAAVLLAAWQTVLYPLESVAGIGGFGAPPSSFQVGMCGTLTTFLVASAVLLAVWAWRGRPAALTGGLCGTGLALFIRAVLPAIGPSTVGLMDVRTFTGAAWGLSGLAEVQLARTSPAVGLPAVPLWSPAILAEALGSGADVAYVGRATRDGDGVHGPAWALVATTHDSARLYLVADDRTNAAGGPVSYRAGDSTGYPGLIPYLDWSRTDVRPGAPSWALGGAGVPVGGTAQRVALAWAVQSPALLHPTTLRSARLAWHLDPAERVSQLFPAAEWGTPQLVRIGGQETWAVPGYLPIEAFPVAPRLQWGEGIVGGVDPGLVALVAPDSGVVRIFLRPGAGPVAQAWAEIAAGVIRPESALPPEARASLTYPSEWLGVQALALAAGGFALPDSSVSAAPDRLSGTSGVVFVDSGPPPRLAARLTGAGGAALKAGLVRYDRSGAPPTPAELVRRWAHFASYGELADTVQMTGDRLVGGPVAYSGPPDSLVASQAVFRIGSHGLPSIVRLNLETGGRLGAGPTPAFAWANLVGHPAPRAPVPADTRIGEIRRWAARADSALRRGDTAAAARALAAIEALLEAR